MFPNSFAEFARKVEAAKPAINGAFLIGHRTLRMNAMATIWAARRRHPKPR